MISDRELIDKLKITTKTKVLDIGGSMMQHSEINVDTLVDIIHPKDAPYGKSKLKAKKFVKVDITREKLPFKNKEFDVVLCSHTLEDLYNPFLIIEEMERVGKRGYIATPSMGADMVFSKIDYSDWLTGARRTPGHSHHKWFFLKKGKKMVIIPKNYGVLFSESFQISGWRGEDEFEFFWKDKIEYEAVSELNIHELIDFYEEFIRDNRDKIKFGKVFTIHDSIFNKLKAQAKLFLGRGRGFEHRRERK